MPQIWNVSVRNGHVMPNHIGQHECDVTAVIAHLRYPFDCSSPMAIYGAEYPIDHAEKCAATTVVQHVSPKKIIMISSIIMLLYGNPHSVFVFRDLINSCYPMFTKLGLKFYCTCNIASYWLWKYNLPSIPGWLNLEFIILHTHSTCNLFIIVKSKIYHNQSLTKLHIISGRL